MCVKLWPPVCIERALWDLKCARTDLRIGDGGAVVGAGPPQSLCLLKPTLRRLCRSRTDGAQSSFNSMPDKNSKG